jgi:hypothetical protein
MPCLSTKFIFPITSPIFFPIRPKDFPPGEKRPGLWSKSLISPLSLGLFRYLSKAYTNRKTCTIWLFNIAMEMPFLIGKPSINGPFNRLSPTFCWCEFHRNMGLKPVNIPNSQPIQWVWWRSSGRYEDGHIIGQFFFGQNPKKNTIQLYQGVIQQKKTTNSVWFDQEIWYPLVM